MPFSFPDWLEARLVSDAAFGNAYDALAPEVRAHIKTAIARIAAVCGSPDALQNRSARFMRQGFQFYEATRPVDWAVVFWDGEYAGPTRILAALLPALLAGVPNVLACRVAPKNSESFPPAVLASLELAGQESAAELSPEEAVALAEHCCRSPWRGRVALLGGASYLAPVALAAQNAGTLLRHKTENVRIAIDAGSLPGDYVTEPHGMLRFAQPDAAFALVPPQKERGAAETGFSAVLCGENAARNLLCRFPLVLTPGHEACWIWSDMDMAFYQETSRAFGAANAPQLQDF